VKARKKQKKRKKRNGTSGTISSNQDAEVQRQIKQRSNPNSSTATQQQVVHLSCIPPPP
jgi:hypothetical protein